MSAYVVTDISDWPAINEIPTTSILGLINLLERLTELRETFYFLDY